MAGARAGADIGGTFTDVVVVVDERVIVRKVLSSVDDFARSVVTGSSDALDAAGAGFGDLDQVVHATTVVTNAVLEGKGARTGLLTTAGFRDVLELGRLRRPNLYDLAWRRPPPLVPRDLRLEVDERVDSQGKVLRPLDGASARAAIAALLRAGVDAVAVCLLNSYVNPAHERLLGELLATAAPDVAVTLSSSLLPEVREYERMSTSVVDAYVSPVLRGYVERLGRDLAKAGSTAPLLLVQSNGGAVPAAVAVCRAAALVESGPAAGALAVASLARALGRDAVIGLDIGGTTAKACLVEHGEVRESQELEVGAGLNVESRLLCGGGYAVSLPSVDLAEVGTGGGSIARVDPAGGLHVGPDSAGSTPGPACYGRGGTEATTTDAFAVLGFLGEEGLAGGAQPIDVEAARTAVARSVAEPLGIDVDRAAWGIFQVGVAGMLRAVRAVTIERGRDPRGVDVVAFGGAGPLHAAEVAAQLGAGRVVVPPLPGVFSAVGLLLADIRFDLQAPVMAPAADFDASAPLPAHLELEVRAGAELRTLGIDPGAAVAGWRADLRYAGQNADLAVIVERGATVADLVEAFHAEHLQAYGRRDDAAPVVFTTARLALRIPDPARSHAALVDLVRRSPAPVRSGERPVWFASTGRVATEVLCRRDLGTEPRPGPLLVAEYDTTTVVPPGATARLDDLHDIVVELA